MIRADEGSDQMPLSPLNPMNVSEMRCVWWFSHHCEGGHPTCGRPVRHEHMADRRRRPWARRSRPTSTDDVARWQATLSVSPILSKRQPQAVAGQGRPAWHGFAMKWSELGHEVRGDWHDPISWCPFGSNRGWQGRKAIIESQTPSPCRAVCGADRSWLGPVQSWNASGRPLPTTKPERSWLSAASTVALP